MNETITATITGMLCVVGAVLEAAAKPPATSEDLTDYRARQTRDVEDKTARRKSQKIIARPTKQQLAFQDLELGLFIHFGLPTYTGRSSGKADDSPKLFNPKKLDCEQWAQVAKSMGATYVVLTARHEGGFCIWPTKTTDYSLKSSPWKNGKGDVVQEFVDACRKHALKVGLYHSSAHDAHHAALRRSGPEGLEEFTRMQEQQVTELLTHYGPITYLWFDHHAGGEFWRRIDATVRRLQPECVIFGQDVWIIGGHSGKASYPLWYAQDTEDGTSVSRPVRSQSAGSPWGEFYRAWEANTCSSGHWFWDPRPPESLESLVDKYDDSVGRGANFLPNFAPNPDGLMPETVVRRASELGSAIRTRFRKPIAEIGGMGDELFLELPKPSTIHDVVIMEQLADGQKIAMYRVDAMIDGVWEEIASGQTIGHKRIHRVRKENVQQLRFVCLDSLVKPIEIRRLAVY